MKNFSVHHIHVKFGQEVYTLSHDSGCISLTALVHFVSDILEKGK